MTGKVNLLDVSMTHWLANQTLSLSSLNLKIKEGDPVTPALKRVQEKPPIWYLVHTTSIEQQDMGN
jgi:hypothetical protein